MASLAPVAGSLAIWAVTRSAFSLVFAALGPLVALGSLLDGKLAGRRRAKEGSRRFASDVETTLDRIRAEHARQIAALEASTPAAGVLLGSSRHEPERWRSHLDSELLVCVGRGRVASTLRLSGDPSAGADDNAAAAFERIRLSAASIDDAPVQVDARLGIGICGPASLAAAIARGIIVQLAHALSPSETELSCPAGSAFESLPHHTSAVSDAGTAEFCLRIDTARAGVHADPVHADPANSVMVATAQTPGGLPRRCRIVISVGDKCAILRHPDPERTGPLNPEPVSAQQLRTFAALLAAAARDEGITSGPGNVPALVRFDSLAASEGADLDRHHLSATVGMFADGPATIDLVGDGPHVLIGGTTGSGKSELLVSWVLAMAAVHSPGEVNFLLVDFKGGSSFTAVRTLPHSVGLITDLDADTAERALMSLRAELRYRERLLAASGARAIDDLDDDVRLPRLVIVIDEFAAMVNDFPPLHELFADVAARGRSLGVHLIACSQRPAGAVRDSVLANCTLRICLRVNNQADSIAVIGTAAAATLPRSPLGRGMISVAGSEPRLAQIALATPADVERVGRAWPRMPVRRPWCEPLPPRVTPGQLPPGKEPGIAFGLLDLPEEQIQEVAVYDPERHGNLMVLGGHGSGKTGVLAALRFGNAEAVWLPAAAEDAWDTVLAQVRTIRATPGNPCLLLVDDVDVLIGRFPEEYRHAFVEALTTLAREGGAAGVHMAVTAQRLGGAVHGIAALCDSRLLLRLADRQEHLLAGGVSGDFTPTLVPGRAIWHGHRMQIALAPAVPPPDVRQRPRLEIGQHRTLAVVSARPHSIADRLRERSGEGAGIVELAAMPEASTLSIGEGPGRTIVVADPDTWQTHWALFARLKADAPVIFDGCGTAQFRALTGLRELPPPIVTHSGAVWVLSPDGTVQRAVL